MPVIAVAGVAVIIAALAALLVQLGAKPLGKLIVGIIPNFHIPGFTNLRDEAQHILNGIINDILGWLDSWIGPLEAIVVAPVSYFVHLFSAITNGIYELYQTADWVVTTLVPREIGSLERTVAADLTRAEDFAKALVSGIGATIAADLTKAEHYAGDLFHTAETDISGAVRTAENYAKAGLTALAGTVAADLAHAESYALATATGLFRTAETDILGLGSKVAAEVGQLGSALAQDVTELGAKIVQAESVAISTTLGVIATDIDKIVKPITIELDDAISGVIDIAATDFPDILQWIKGIDLTKVTDIAGVTALSVAVAGALTRYLEKCGLPNCRNLSSLGRDLEALLSLVGDASFLALIVELARNPNSGAHLVMDVFGPIANGAMSTARDLIGV